MGPSRREFVIVQACTVARIPLSIFFAIVLTSFENTTAVIWTAGMALFFVEITDFFDGYLARKFNTTTEWGAMLDPYADSISRLIAFWALAHEGYVFAALPLIMALRDVSVSYCRIILTRHDQTVSARLSGKLKAVVQGFGGGILMVFRLIELDPWPSHVVGGLIVAVTLYSLWDYATAALPFARREVQG